MAVDTAMQVRSVANLAGVSPHTVRYYVRRGLLAPTRDAKSGYHRFGERDMRTLFFIRRAQALGFTLREIETIVETGRRHASPCPVVRDIVRRRVVEFSKQLLELDQRCRVMRAALRRWRRMPDSIPHGEQICPLIESVQAAGLTFEQLEGGALMLHRTGGRVRRK